jgi:hypothetical protein
VGSAHFVYGPTPLFGAVTPTVALAPDGSVQAATATLTGLQPATTYYFALVVSNPDGTVTGQATSLKTLLPPVPASVVCKVPKLKGDTLTQAKKALKRAHCAPGKVQRPKHPGREKLFVISQRPTPGAVRRKGFKVSIKLGPKPSARTHHR